MSCLKSTWWAALALQPTAQMWFYGMCIWSDQTIGNGGSHLPATDCEKYSPNSTTANSSFGFHLNGRSSLRNRLAWKRMPTEGKPNWTHCSVIQCMYMCKQKPFACVLSHALFFICSLSQVALTKFLGLEFGLFLFQLVLRRHCLHLAQVHSPVLAAYCFSSSSDISEVFSLTSAVFLFHFSLDSIFKPRMRAGNGFSLI